jgi:hypothetical protein
MMFDGVEDACNMVVPEGRAFQPCACGKSTPSDEYCMVVFETGL